MQRDHKHRWTAWGPFEPVLQWLKHGRFATDDISPEPPEAIRCRYCECGAKEVEQFSNGERRIVSNDETGAA